MATAVSENSPGFLSPLRDRNIVLLWLSQMISSLGNWALMTAIPITVYNGTGSKAALSISEIMYALPVLLFGLFAGVMADRWDRRRTMIVSDLARAAIMLLLLLLPQAQHLSRPSLLLLYTVLFLITTLGCFFTPARQALMALLLPRDRLLQANALTMSGMQITQMVGPVVGGLLLGWIAPRGVFIFDAITFLLSGVLVLGLGRPPAVDQTRVPKGPKGIWDDAVAGLRYLGGNRIMMALILLQVIAILGAGIYTALEYAFARDLWHATPRQFGYLLSMTGLGMLVGGAMTTGPIGRIAPNRLTMLGFGIMAASGLGWAYAPTLLVGAIALFAAGVGNVLVYLPAVTLFQTLVPNEMLGRVASSFSLSNNTAAVTSGALAAGLSLLVGHSHPAFRALFASLAGTFLVCALLALPLLREQPEQESPETFAKSAGDDVREPAAAES